jgi:hypothetical protein
MLLGMVMWTAAEEAVPDSAEDEWEQTVKAEAKAAEVDFATWKSTGKLPEDFESHALRGERADLVERQFSGDKLAETEINVTLAATPCEVELCGSAPMETELKVGPSSETVWRRITKDRFEIWTPKGGKLYDAAGKKVAEAKVRRGDGWGREWYGAFLPDGRWITTDIDERDDTVTAFSAQGKRLWAVKGAKLVAHYNEIEGYPSLPLIAWARSDKSGKGWIVSVGSESGRGVVRLTPDGKWTKVGNPWTECFPQQLRARGMYTFRSSRSDDGALQVTRAEDSHGMRVGWPIYQFPTTANVMIHNGRNFGVLVDSRTVFIEADCEAINSTAEERKDERVWLFDGKGVYQHWMAGRAAGASLTSGGLWVRLVDDSAMLLDKACEPKSHRSFSTKDKKSLIPVELHDDIGLGLFLAGEELVLGKWE